MDDRGVGNGDGRLGGDVGEYVDVGGLPLSSTVGPSGDGIGDGGRLTLSSSGRGT